MKKIFLFAAAAMVSLSSCVQTNEVYTGGVQEIGFKSAVTKAAIETATFDGSMTVAAAWDQAATPGVYKQYFAPYKFTGTATTPWAGDPDAKYWPNAGNMQFIACYPYGIGTFAETIDATAGITGYTVTGIDNSDLTKQNDVLFSDLHTVEAPQTSAQALAFHHALALLKVNFATANTSEEVIVKSATVHNVVLGGKLTVTAAATSTAEWAGTTATPNALFQNVDTTNPLTATADEDATAMLVVPGEQTSMTIVYTFNGHEMTKTVDLTKLDGDDTDVDTWDMGKKYIYNFTISANEIKFTCTVDTWTDVVSGGITI